MEAAFYLQNRHHLTYSPAILAFVSSIPGLKQLAEIVVRVTFFNQFVGGETAEDTIPLLETLRARNKGVLFAYSVEVDEHAGSSGATAQYRKNVEEMIHSIDVAADFEDRHALSTVQGLSGRKTWVALKLTALVPSADALAHFSEYLLKTRPSDGLVHYPGTPHSTDLDILSQSNPPPNSSITAEDFEALRTLKDDLERICRRAKDRNVKVIIDAEHTWCQPAIDAFQLSLTREFNSFRSSNRASEPTVYGTYQAYLRRNTMHLLRSLEDAQREGYALGVKLVRGAYHSQEHKHISPYEPANVSLAQSRIKEAGSGFPQHQQGPRPPVWDEKWETDAAYNAAAALMLDLLRRPNSSIGVLFGTHNKESCDLIIMGLVARGLANPIDRSGSDNESQRFWVNNQIVNRISFGQLYGMCDALTDHLTNSLEASSPVVLKYVPYGALRDHVRHGSQDIRKRRSWLKERSNMMHSHGEGRRTTFNRREVKLLLPMPKRKEPIKDAEDDDSGSEPDFVNVDFDFFDPRPIDYLALKRLLAQLFQVDSEGFQLNDLADLILSQPLLGTTVKTDGIDSDPYAILTVLNINIHKEHPSIQALVSYLLSKSASNPSAHAALQRIIGKEALDSSNHVGLVLCERLVNMPIQVIPPMYRMLADEIKWANDEKEPYTFENYIVLSRIYRLSAFDVNSMMEDEEQAPTGGSTKKRKVERLRPQAGTHSFHQEDECIQKAGPGPRSTFASHTLDYEFTNRQPREGEDAFGLDVAGRMMVVPASKFSELVQALGEAFPVPS
ncbi:hypothetical protein FRB99_006105 [Tulasnella sp. 403]|nr:hypothetical protein FRB99_006105 [Tulasnella sp. 403]